MPYGLPNETPEMTRWVEGCVEGITGTNKRTNKPYTKGEKIAICKTQLKKQGYKTSDGSVSETSLRDIENEIYDALKRDLSYTDYSPVSPSYDIPWLVDTYVSYVIIEDKGKFWKVPYTADDEISFDWEYKVQVIKKTTYESVSEWVDVRGGRITRGFRTI